VALALILGRSRTGSVRIGRGADTGRRGTLRRMVAPGPSARIAGPRPRGELGQASVEHVAVVSLVAIVLAAAVVVSNGFGGTGIVNGVHSGIRRALCVASGDGCAAFHVRRPCVVGADRDERSQGLSLGFWRLGADRSLAVERRSDGSVVVTAYDDVEGGVGASIGVRFGPGRSSSGDDEEDELSVDASAGVEGRLRGGWGRTWEFPDGSTAQAFLKRWAARRSVRPPDVERVRIAANATMTGEVSGPLGIATGKADALRGFQGEGTRDRRTGRTTVSLAISGAASADLAGPLGLKLGGSVALERSATLVTDGDLRPRELVLMGSLADRHGSRRRDVQLRVDLTRPQVAAGLSGILRDLVSTDVGRARATAVALGRWAAEEGWIDQREFATETDTDGYDDEIALGAKLGVRDTRTRSSERLVDARSRPPGGLWEDRTDCLPPRS
jgi:hypothetical protein